MKKVREMHKNEREFIKNQQFLPFGILFSLVHFFNIFYYLNLSRIQYCFACPIEFFNIFIPNLLSRSTIKSRHYYLLDLWWSSLHYFHCLNNTSLFFSLLAYSNVPFHWESDNLNTIFTLLACFCYSNNSIFFFFICSQKLKKFPACILSPRESNKSTEKYLFNLEIIKQSIILRNRTKW